jgi:hypothetical protein
MRWPIGIAIGFAVVVLVNVAFLVVAVQTHEDPLPSYATTQKR